MNTTDKEKYIFSRLYVFTELQHDEGLKLKPYRCPAGKLTIGYGRNLEATGISEIEAREMLWNDVIRVDKELQTAIKGYNDLPEKVREVLLNMAFNLGVKGLLGFTKTLSLIEQGKYLEASEEMLNSKWAKQVGDRAVRLSDKLKGLVK